jgi:hypothetical protein
MQKNNLLFIVFDSCRYDTFAAARAPWIKRLGEVEQRYSFASWTFPSHSVYLMGQSPHKSPKQVFASEVYKEDFKSWGHRLGIPDISFKAFVPRLSLPAYLREQGYRTKAMVSMPVLNQTTILNQHFDSYELMAKHNDFRAIIDKIEFVPERPTFYFINVGETHYPYTLPGEKAEDLPILHGLHGVVKHMDDLVTGNDAPGSLSETRSEFFDEERMLPLKRKQQSNIEYLDTLFEQLYAKCPPNTYFIVTSDHGECFGEDGYFGHGPIVHEKVFEVFLVEGMRP